MMKKTTRSPHLPAKMNPKPMKNSKMIGKITFNMGRFSSIDEDAQMGNVKRAKMTIEDRVRKEKRDKMIEEIRKPIILTPGSKRGRKEEEEWDTPQPGTGGAAASLLGGSGRRSRMTQTPINSFLVTQTPEERKIILEKKTKKLFTDMSSSSASPKLKRAAGRAIKIRKTQEVTRKLPMSAGKVSLLSK